MAPGKVCVNKLKKEMKSYIEAPPPYIPAIYVNERNMLEWHYLIEGPPDSPYAGGWYIGKLRFPVITTACLAFCLTVLYSLPPWSLPPAWNCVQPEYPFKPPGILMLTPSGRFETNTRLCLSISDFHPESWQPSWSVASILTGLLSFMLEDTATTGSISTTDDKKREFARRSLDWNLRNAQFKAMFPQLQKAADERSAGPSAASSSAAGAAGSPRAVDASDGTSSGQDGARELDPDDAAALEEATKELDDADPEAALSRLDRRLKRHKQAPPLQLLKAKAKAMARIGDVAAAAQLLTTAASDNDLKALGGWYQDIAAATKAVDAADGPGGEAEVAALKLSQVAQLVRLQHDMDRWQKAAGHKDTGNAAFRKQDYTGAAKAYEQCLALEPDCAAVSCNLAATLANLGQHEGAVQHAQAALRVNRSYAKAQRRLADSLAALGRHAEAAALYIDLVKAFPRDPALKEALQRSKKAT